MATYVVLFSLTAEGAKNAKEIPQGIDDAHKRIEGMGGKVIGCYGVMGPYDFIGIYDLPSDQAAVMYALGMAMSGYVHSTTMKAFPYEEFGQIIKEMPQ